MQKRDSIKVLKVRFDKVTLQEASEIVLKWLKDDKKRYITTPNPEIILEAQKNHKFLKILNHSKLNIADGSGILWAAKYLDSIEKNKSASIKILKWIKSILLLPFQQIAMKKVLPERVTGTDLMQEICKTTKKPIYLLGAREGIGEIAREKLKKKYPKVNIVDTYAGSPKISDEKEIIKKINSAEPEVLFVAYGAPNQEIWIDRNIKRLKTVKIAIGVGGAFDFIAQKRKRAPKWMQKMGLEWLYRLIQEPSRIKRIYNATIKFPIIVLKRSLK